MATYVVSDLHFNHATIIEKERLQFQTIEEHNEYIIFAINKKVKKDDILYVLGDVGFGKDFGRYLKRLNGYKILIKGNHDTKSEEFYHECGFSEVYNHPVFYDKRIVLSHRPFPVTKEYINIHGHLHSAYLDEENFINTNIHILNYKPLRIDGPKISKIKQQLPKINNKFLYEWYADKHVFTVPHNFAISDENGHIKYEETMEKLRNMEKDKEEH